MVNVRRAEIQAQHEAKIDGLYEKIADLEDRLESNWGTDKQREGVEAKIQEMKEKLESGWGTEAQRAKLESKIQVQQSKLDAPWGTDKQRAATSERIEKLNDQIERVEEAHETRDDKIEDRMMLVQERREEKYGAGAVAGAVIDAVFSGGKKSGCVLPHCCPR